MALGATQVKTLGQLDGEKDFAALMIRVRERDRAAFEELFVHFGPRVKALMLKSGSGHAMAEDIVQDVFMAVWRKAGYFSPGRGTVSAWIFSIARNSRIDKLRRMSSRPYDDIMEMEFESPEPDAEQVLATTERNSKVADAIVDLPGTQREIIELAYMHDMAQTEIAKRLSLPLGTVKSRMRLAYAKLKLKLEEAR
ncbi:sigma-70 family RNA polymerase sigma factor [Oricola thermophila]|uniref:RNA polymerase sigma factor n=1 Tax=Oricola thermophila TaxID=2742145 RepID=A0A6N1V908_9HYPH|nr:sigma-70 family RNA polymerase sigma factor [Oricola thermophila]QKV17454.1 sigma-70 family RNA polymerase sigma factor [Oricola thermophila]